MRGIIRGVTRPLGQTAALEDATTLNGMPPQMVQQEAAVSIVELKDNTRSLLPPLSGLKHLIL